MATTHSSSCLGQSCTVRAVLDPYMRHFGFYPNWAIDGPKLAARVVGCASIEDFNLKWGPATTGVIKRVMSISDC